MIFSGNLRAVILLSKKKKTTVENKRQVLKTK